jgi:hydrogenase expression/formation protein HypC
MCLAIPMKIAQIGADGLGVADLEGARHEVDLSLVSPVHVGDYVIIHAGFAITRLDEQEAQETLSLLREIGALAELGETA